jgi:hypothetical protein
VPLDFSLANVQVANHFGEQMLSHVKSTAWALWAGISDCSSGSSMRTSDRDFSTAVLALAVDISILWAILHGRKKILTNDPGG